MAISSRFSPSDAFLNDARKRMVESQLRPSKVSDSRILEAMRNLPRERFLPSDLGALAYSDQNVALGKNRTLLQPVILARLIQAAFPVIGEKALVVGAGTGYTAALLAALGCEVIALEDEGELADFGSPLLAAIAPSVTYVRGPLSAGWPAGAPYDVIIIDGAVPEIPPLVTMQLKREGGRLVTIVNGGRQTGYAIQAETTGAGVSSRPLFDCLCPLLPAFEAAPAFEF